MKSRSRPLRLTLVFAMIAAYAISATTASAHSPGANVNGVVTAKTATTLTVLAANGSSSAVTVTAATIYRLPHRLTGTFADVLVGSRIKVEGTRTGTVLTAAVLKIKWDRVNGVVTALTPLTVMAKNGTSRIIGVTGATVYRGAGHVSAVLGDIRIGSRIKAEGTLNGVDFTARYITTHR